MYDRTRFWSSATALLACLGAAAAAPGQISSRAEEIQQARQEKQRHLEPDGTSDLEQALVQVRERKILERVTAGIAGFRLAFGNLATGSGFALGPEYLRRDLADGQLVLRGSARGSLRRYYLMDLQLSLPKLAGERVFADLYGARRDYPQMPYYGPGPDSRKTGRSNFRLEDTSFDVTAGVRPARNLSLGLAGGYTQLNVGPGTDRRFASADTLYSSVVTPGIDRQADFLRGGFFAQYDYRDHPGGPRSGGNYLVRYTAFSDRKLDFHSFRRLELELQQYIPFFNARRVIALRGRSVLSYDNPGQRVPFYWQPTLGGSDDLRGFRPFRFYDDNMMVLNAEYRWESFSGLDMALFVDAGKVFPRRAQWNFASLEASYGIGMRFNIRNSVFLRLDSGFSQEGYQVWVKFGNVF
jgi:outer membrane protein assembly factor BamA